MQSSESEQKDPVILQIESIKRSLMSHTESLVQEQVQAEMRGLKTSINSVFDTIETLQRSQSLFQKEINMRINAITGHERRKNQVPKIDYVTPELSFEEAVEVAKKLKAEKQPESTKSPGPGKRV